MNKSSLKYFGMVVSIILFIVGLVIVFNPFASDVIINYMFVITLGIAGISNICKYASMEQKSVWNLVGGILDLVICIMLLNSNVLVLEATMGYILSVSVLIRGIGLFFTAAQVKKIDPSVSIALYIVEGIILVLIAAFFIGNPIIAKVANTYVLGIFLVVDAIITFIEAISIKITSGEKE